MQNDHLKYNYDDVAIIPDIATDIVSRKRCDWKTSDGVSPIWVAPMDTVVSVDNWKQFYDAFVNVVIPRNVKFEERIDMFLKFSTYDGFSPFIAFSLQETAKIFNTKNRVTSLLKKGQKEKENRCFRFCIDMANGHMLEQITLIKEIKDNYGDQVMIMGGNIANPETYRLYDEAGCDFLRTGIGGGSACLTASNVSVFYPLFSLLKETYEVKKRIGGKCRIIADGGIKGFRDVQKALVYADYVMIGGLFNKTIESAGKTTYGSFYWNIRGKKIYRPLKTLLYYGKEVPKKKYDEVIKLIKENKVSIWKEFYGMSTKRAQESIIRGNDKEFDKKKLKTSEGIVLHQKVEYSIVGWMRNEIDYLRSAMSYTNSRNLEEYKESEWVAINDIKYNK